MTNPSPNDPVGLREESFGDVLLGVLAVQFGLLDQRRLLAEVNAIPTTFREQGEGSILRLVDPNWHKDLERIRDRLIANQGGTARQALATFLATEELLRTLRADMSSSTLVSLSTWTNDERMEKPATAGGSDPIRGVPPPRYRILRAHKEGGLGKVSLAHDTELNREVAFKEIKPRLADCIEGRKRFLREAEITGRLEHPGIVPVYGLGRQLDGRPYYAMRFIAGQSLREVISAFHVQVTESARVKRKHMELRRLLGYFIDVCQAVHFAHTRGIIHRDLKPENIMVGEFGEVLVVDWGLARSFHTRSPSDSLARDASAQALSGVTAPMFVEPEIAEPYSIPGAAAGTLQYMSPEQARGELAALNTSTDIFSLGAILYAILVDQPPIRGESRDELMRNAKECHWTFPKDSPSLLPRALESICAKAMAKDPADRYQSSGEVAADVERFLGDEPIHCHRESWSEQARRWLRKHPRSVAALAATLVMGFICSLAITLVTIWKNAEAERARTRADKVLETMVDAFRSPDPRRAGKDVTVMEVMEQVASSLNEVFSDDPEASARLHRSIGTTYLGLGQHPEAAKLLSKSCEIYEQSMGPEHEETLVTMSNLGVVYTAVGDWIKARQMLTVASEGLQRRLPQGHPYVLAARNNLAALNQSEQSAQAIHELETNLRLAQSNLGIDHKDTLSIQNTYGMALLKNGDFDSAQTELTEILDLARARYGEGDLVTQMANQNLSVALYQRGKLPPSLALMQRAYNWKVKHLLEDDPSRLMTANNLALAFQAMGNLPKAIELMESTLAMRSSELGEMHPDTVDSLKGLLGMRLEGADFPAAAKLLETWEACIDGDTVAGAREQIQAAIIRAEILLGQGNILAAEKAASWAVDAAASPSLDSYRAQSVLGAILSQQAKWSDAEYQLRRGSDGLTRNLTTMKPHLRWLAASASKRLIDLYTTQGDTKQAARSQAELDHVAAEIKRLRLEE